MSERVTNIENNALSALNVENLINDVIIWYDRSLSEYISTQHMIFIILITQRSKKTYSKIFFTVLEATFFIGKGLAVLAMFPLTIHKIFKMLCVVSITDYAFMTVLGRCRSCHHFDFFSHSYGSTVSHKKV